jgi:hypothetical protein
LPPISEREHEGGLAESMLRSMVSRALWVGRATSAVVGLAILLALVVGLASAAFGANGQAWVLGRDNSATAITRLGGAAGVDGPMVRITNNDAGTDDKALALNVQEGEAPLGVNRDTLVANLNSDQVDGFHAGCASGRRLIEGLCYDENPQPEKTVTNAADECHRLGGQLPSALQLRSIRSEPGIDLDGPTATPTWSADLQFKGPADPPNDLHAVAVFDTGGLQVTDDQQERPFRCVYQPLTPE